VLTALLLALCLHRPAPLVESVYQAGQNPFVDPVLRVATVEAESQFNPRAVNVNRDGSTDWGLWQLNSRWHPQFRDAQVMHVEYGAVELLRRVLEARGDLRSALSAWNTGNPKSARGQEYASRVLVLYMQLKWARW